MFLLILERKGEGVERGRERKREKHLSVVSHKHPDWGLNPQPFGLWDNALTN